MITHVLHLAPRWNWLSCAIVAVGLLAAPVVAQSTASRHSARTSGTLRSVREASDYFPANTLAVARIGDLAQFRQTWQNSSFGAQTADPALARFFRSVLKKLSRLTDGLGVGVTDLWEQVDGEISLAAIKDHAGQLAVVAVADLNDDVSAQELVQQLETKLQAEAADLTTVEVATTPLRSWRRAGPRNLPNVSFFVQGGRVVFGEDLQTLAEAARRVQESETATLTGNQNYQHLMSRIAPGGNRSGMNWYVNPEAVVETAASVYLGGGPPPDKLRQMVDAFGLDQVRGVGGTMWLGQGGMDSVSTTYGYVQTPLHGPLKALTMSARAQRPPDWVKENVSLYAQINWSVDRFVETLREVVDESRGAGAFDKSLGSLQVTDDGATLADVAQTIDGPLHVAAEVPQNASELLQQRAVIGFGVRDPALVRGLLRHAAERRQRPTEKIGGAELLRFRFDLSQALPGAGELPPLEMGIAVTDDAVLISPNAEYLAETFSDRGDLRPLADSPDYRQIASQFPERTAMITFQRQDGRLEGLYEQLRGGLLSSTGLPGIAGGLTDLDFKALPSFASLSRYLQSTGSFIVPEQDGFRIVSLALPPREE